MAGESSDESNLGGVAANAGCSMHLGNQPVSSIQSFIAKPHRLVLLLVLSLAGQANAQIQPSWWPPMSLYGHPVSSPYFEFPVWSRYSNCRPAPLAWGYNPFPNYGPCDNAPGCPSINCPGGFVAHRPSAWYFTSDFAPTTVDFQNTRALAALGTTGPVVLSTADLQPNFDAGTRLTIGRRIWDCYRLEGTYWG